MKNHYESLGLQEGASQEAIQEAFERLSKELNPANNENQEFFIEEHEKVQEAYKVLYNSSILASEKVITKPLKVSKNRKVSNNTEEKSDGNYIKKYKVLILKFIKYILLFIFLTIFLKITVHFFIYPSEVEVTNTDKKVYVNNDVSLIQDYFLIKQKDYSTKSTRTFLRLEKLRNDGYVERKDKYIYENDYVSFYYPQEKIKKTIALHIKETFLDRLFIFKYVIIVLMLFFWIFLDKTKSK